MSSRSSQVYVALVLLSLLSAAAAAALVVPPPLAHNATLIALSQARVRAGDKAALAAAATAQRWAEEALPRGPWSVTQCPHPAPDGNARSYFSIAKYFWPCNSDPCNGKPPSKCDETTGLPWVDCDGRVNPIVEQYALPRVTNMSAAVSALATGYLFNNSRTDFAERAALLLRTFFLDDATGMLPSLDFAQAEPGQNNGSHWGIIELSAVFTSLVLDSISFIAPSGAWTEADQTKFLAWLAAMQKWLRTSALGTQEYGAFNNHQIYYTSMLGAIEVWLGNYDAAVSLLRATLEPPPAGNVFAPLGVQIASDGELPAEEARTNSGGYVNFATLALLELGSIARSPALVAAGAPDLLTYITHSNHSGVKAAVDFMVPYASGDKPWPFQNITKTPWNTYISQFRIAGATAGWESSHATYAATVAQLRERSDDPLSLFWPIDAAPALPAAPVVQPSGDPVVVWAAVDTLHKCGIIDVPDIPARAFVDVSTGLTHMIVGSTNFHRMNGPNLYNLSRECAAAWNETADPNPSHFAGDEFLDSTVALPNGTVYTLIHTEYPGNVYHNCTGPAYPLCWTVTIGLAVSHDSGMTWAHALPPPAHLVAAVPYGYNASQLAYGWGDPSNIIEKDGFYYAAVWNRNQVGLQAPGVCVMRVAADSIGDPSAWRAWGGEAYNVSFVSPYTLAPGTEGDHVCTVTNLPGCPIGGWAWSTYLSKYVATLDCSLQAGSQFYIAYSDDLQTWSAPAPFYNSKALPQNVSKVVTSMSYPTMMDPSSGDANFGTIGQNPALFWVSIGHSPYSDGRHLWATPFSFE